MEIPKEVKKALEVLQGAKFEAYIVGGCVRDLLRNIEPQDWDLTTNAKPEEIQEVFNAAGFRSFYENAFGTVTVLMPKSRDDETVILSEAKDLARDSSPAAQNDANVMEIEITPFRAEAKYSDKRHPDSVKFVKSLKQDLARRDFTANAMAIESQKSKVKSQKYNSKYKIIDFFEGQNDLQNKVIRAVGKPEQRFQEDGLRMLRAVRFAICLDNVLWQIEPKTFQAIVKNANLLGYIAKERIKDELAKIIMSPNGAKGIEILRRYGLLQYIIPELEQGFANTQNKHHIYQIYQHNVLSLNYACQKGFTLEVRLAALLHDIAKPKTKKGQGPDATFYGHEIVGAKMCQRILQNLKFSKKEIEKITRLVRYHLFYYNTGEVGESSVRRLLRNVGPEYIEELLQVRQADRIGSAVPKAEPYKLRHLKYLFEKVSKDPISAKMLKINGSDIMQILNVPAGPKVGQILSYFLSQVLSDPQKNVLPYLEEEIRRLGKMSEPELAALSQKAKKEIETVETKRDEMTKQKYWVT